MGKLSQAIDAVARRTRSVQDRNLKDAADALAAEVRAVLSTPGSRKSRSRPGDPPRSQSGNLLRSVGTRPVAGGQSIDVVVAAPYASYLERGTPKMAARPFFSVAWQRVRVKITALLQRRS